MGREDNAEKKKLSALAAQVVALTRDELLIRLRFLDTALAGLTPTERYGSGTLATDGARLYYDPLYVLRLYRRSAQAMTHSLLHSLLHCVFAHPFGYEHLEQGLWDLACDIAVEAVIAELALDAVTEPELDLSGRLKVLREDAGGLTAEKLYRRFQSVPLPERTLADYRRCFVRDDHSAWKPAERYDLTAEDWRQISRRIRAELKSFSERHIGGEALAKSLEEATREVYDYGAILRRFLVLGEQTAINDEEFDYIYYTYGLSHYGNLPLIEPLESREERKLRDLVIAIDTSASCSGATVERFLRRTFSLLHADRFFFRRCDIHIVQCDAEIQSDIRIRSTEEIDRLLAGLTIRGYGATDFRPVFSYIEELREAGELADLRGLIYFTDGYGIYPELRPDYEVVWAFLGEDETRSPVPLWSTKVILSDEPAEGTEAPQPAGTPITEIFTGGTGAL